MMVTIDSTLRLTVSADVTRSFITISVTQLIASEQQEGISVECQPPGRFLTVWLIHSEQV